MKRNTKSRILGNKFPEKFGSFSFAVKKYIRGPPSISAASDVYKRQVYKFSNEIREITKEQYLRENPNKTEEDFLKLKEISDEIFLDEIRYETAQGKKLVPTEDLENDPSFAATPVDEQYIQKENNEQDGQKLDKLFRIAKLTEKQKNRLYLHCADGKTFRAIAAMEGIHWTSVEECVNSALKKLKKYGNKIK